MFISKCWTFWGINCRNSFAVSFKSLTSTHIFSYPPESSFFPSVFYGIMSPSPQLLHLWSSPRYPGNQSAGKHIAKSDYLLVGFLKTFHILKISILWKKNCRNSLKFSLCLRSKRIRLNYFKLESNFKVIVNLYKLIKKRNVLVKWNFHANTKKIKKKIPMKKSRVSEY